MSEFKCEKCDQWFSCICKAERRRWACYRVVWLTDRLSIIIGQMQVPVEDDHLDLGGESGGA